MRVKGRLEAPILILSVLSLGGCAKDRRLAPPPDSENVQITVKVPDQLQAQTVEAIYRSKTCQRLRGNGNGEYVKFQGYNRMEIEPKRRGDTDLYDAYVPMDGGGACNWHLSSAEFGVVYANPRAFGDDVAFGYGGGVEVYFDPATSQVGMPSRESNGDINLIENYYPWLSETFLGGYRKRVNMFNGWGVRIGYLAPTARKIYFEPVLHSDIVVRSVHPKVKKKGNYPVFTYSDGSVIADARTEPDFRRLQAIRLKLEANK